MQVLEVSQCLHDEYLEKNIVLINIMKESKEKLVELKHSIRAN